ncbi:MAG TPA: RDD family protein [Longimicrobiales bacterium]
MKARGFITPDSFSVSPNLLGLPLAAPTRRAAAMAIDGILVALLVQAGGVFLGLTAVFVLLRASRSTERGGYVRSSVRFALRAGAAILLFVVVLKAWNLGEEKIQEQTAPPPGSASHVDPDAGHLNLKFAPGEGIAVAAAVAGLARADEPDEITAHARTLLSSAQRAGATPAQLREARTELIALMGDDGGDDDNVAALDSVIASIAGPLPPELSTTDSLQAIVTELRSDVARLDARNDSLASALETAREAHGVRSYISAILDDLGLGFGWAAVYFTAFLAMMRGQTPGKRTLGIRVIRLDGKPLGWWISLERFGGYAASFSLGLLGFAQILWDRNRQGLHDKACETVVVLEKAQPAVRK